MKRSVALLIIVILASLFVVKSEASAASQAFPSTVSTQLGSCEASAYSTNYNFIIGADGIFVNDSERSNEELTSLYCTTSYASGIMQISFDTGTISSAKFFHDNLGKCDGICLTLTPAFTGTLTYDDYGLNVFQKTLVRVRPYILIDGVKYDVSNNAENQILPDEITHLDMEYYLGAEIDVIVSYDASANTLYDVKTTFGTAKLNLSVPQTAISVMGYKHVSTGEQLITDSINNQGQLINESINNQSTTLSSEIRSFSSKVANMFNTLFDYMTAETSNTSYAASYLFTLKELTSEYFPILDNTLDLLLTTADSIYITLQDYRTDFNTFREELSTQLTDQHNSISDKLEEIKNLLTRGYENEASDETQGTLESTISDYEKAESEIKDAAIENLHSYTIPQNGLESYGTELLSGIMLVSGMLQSIYESLEEFKAVVSVLFTLTIVSMLTGLFGFFKR